MAFNNLYNPYMYGGYQMQQPQQQSSSFVSVNNIQEAYNWPVAPGNSITFKDENQPFVYTKTKGFSPLEQPTFERYRLVKVEDAPQKPLEAAPADFDAKSEITMLWKEINALKADKEGKDHDKSADDKSVSIVHE